MPALLARLAHCARLQVRTGCTHNTARALRCACVCASRGGALTMAARTAPPPVRQLQRKGVSGSTCGRASALCCCLHHSSGQRCAGRPHERLHWGFDHPSGCWRLAQAARPSAQAPAPAAARCQPAIAPYLRLQPLELSSQQASLLRGPASCSLWPAPAAPARGTATKGSQT